MGSGQDLVEKKKRKQEELSRKQHEVIADKMASIAYDRMYRWAMEALTREEHE